MSLRAFSKLGCQASGSTTFHNCESLQPGEVGAVSVGSHLITANVVLKIPLFLEVDGVWTRVLQNQATVLSPADIYNPFPQLDLHHRLLK